MSSCKKDEETDNEELESSKCSTCNRDKYIRTSFHENRYRYIRTHHEKQPLFYLLVAKWCVYSRKMVSHLGRSSIQDGELIHYYGFTIEIVDIEARPYFKRFSRSYPTLISAKNREIIVRGYHKDLVKLCRRYIIETFNQKVFLEDSIPAPAKKEIEEKSFWENIISICGF